MSPASPAGPDGRPRHLVVMGVSGSGKTTLATALAERLDLPLADADDFHPPENLARMHAGIPLTDEDRWGWLDLLVAWVGKHDQRGEPTVMSCSALRRSYRDVLRHDGRDVVFVHLTVDPDVIRERMRTRAGGVPPALLDSQLATLEALEPDEQGVTLDAGRPVAELVGTVLDLLAQWGDGLPRGS